LWATQAGKKVGIIGVIGVFPSQAMTAPIGELQQRNLTIKGGNCNHRKYIPKLVEPRASESVLPTGIRLRKAVRQEAAYPSERCRSHKRDRRKSPSHRAGERGARG